MKLQTKERVESDLDEVLKEKEKRQFVVYWKQDTNVFLLDDKIAGQLFLSLHHSLSVRTHDYSIVRNHVD